MTVLGWILSNKLLCIFVLGTTAFCISTIVLGVQNSNLRDEISDLKDQTATTTITTSATSAQTADTDTPAPQDPSTEAPATEIPVEDMSDYRLPTNVIPIHYDLYLYPDLTTSSSSNFEGKVIITVSVEESTGTVKIHNNGLTINEVTINDNPCTTELDTVHELLIITPQNGPLAVGESEISIEFSGSMANRIVGLYVSSYTNEEGEDR